MVSNQLLELENFIHQLSVEDKLWLLGQIMVQLRQDSETINHTDKTTDIQYDPTAKPIWEIAVEIGANIPESEWEKVPSDLSKNFDLYQN
ncbi:hypothetical protein [Planktothrix sp.]|uniref:hypothetical protein n=1 Tax=Planktothrix sp. TaxID=3088171 RepID=UPI0038D36C41